MKARHGPEILQDYRQTCSLLWEYEKNDSDASWEDYLEREGKLRQGVEYLLNTVHAEEGERGVEIENEKKWLASRFKLYDSTISGSIIQEQEGRFEELSKEIAARTKDIVDRKAEIAGRAVKVLQEYRRLVEEKRRAASEKGHVPFIATVVGSLLGWVAV